MRKTDRMRQGLIFRARELAGQRKAGPIIQAGRKGIRIDVTKDVFVVVAGQAAEAPEC